MDSKPTNSKRGAKRLKPDDIATDCIAIDGLPVEAPRRIDRLAEIVDLCLEARDIAQDLDAKLLAFLLAMAVQETRAAMRQQVSKTAGTVRVPTRRPRARRAAV